jgi:hypothetical protein
MAIQSRKNQYRGVNAHLHSLLQAEVTDWAVFHSAHIIDLARAIDGKLPPGYIVAPEKSLQIREYDPDTGERIPLRGNPSISPDIGIYDINSTRNKSPSGASITTTPTLTLSPEPIDDPEDYFTAAVIYEIGKESGIDKAVTRIELLSPSNKPSGSGYGLYREKRVITLVNKIVMVEIDYLHESPPANDLIPNYVKRAPHSYPYSVSVTEPRPSLREGELRIYGFDVDAPMPIIDIPLSGEDVVTVDFGKVYDQTYGSLGFYSYRVDYAQHPVYFETYADEDQARIEVRMNAVQAAYARGMDLEQGPFPLTE